MRLLRNSAKGIRRKIQRRNRKFKYDYKVHAEDAVIKGELPPRPTDYRDDLTLDDLAANDLEMAKYAVKNAKRYGFNTPIAAQKFVGYCVDMTLRRCGVTVIQGMPAPVLQKNMDEEHVSIESRTRDVGGGPGSFYRGDDAWRNGLYIFKAGELVAFVSVPMIENKHPLAVDDKDIGKLEAFDKVVDDGKVFKHDPTASAVKSAAGRSTAGIPFVITNAKVDGKGFSV
jgi:hypothetical protein